MPTSEIHSAIAGYDVYADLQLDATAAISAHDCQAVWTKDFIERAALLSIAEFGALESLLYKAFKADLRLRYWEQAVKEKRTLQSPRADTPASGLPTIITNGTAMHRQTEQALDAIRKANDPPTLFVSMSVVPPSPSWNPGTSLSAAAPFFQSPHADRRTTLSVPIAPAGSVNSPLSRSVAAVMRAPCSCAASASFFHATI